MTIEDWIASACADADRRGMPDLKPLLASLADATKALRNAGWEDLRCARVDARPHEPLGPAEPPPEGAAR
jgi:hypothetical protein